MAPVACSSAKRKSVCVCAMLSEHFKHLALVTLVTLLLVASKQQQYVSAIQFKVFIL